MDQIFRGARTVHIWLGLKADVPTNRFFELVPSIQQYGLDSALTGGQIDNAFLDSLEDLLCRPWWARLWVIQESVLARGPLVHLGQDTVALKAIVAIALAIMRYSVQEKFSHLDPAMQKRLRALCRHYRRVSSLSGTTLSPAAGVLEVHTIMIHFQATNSHGTTDGRDRVYALLGTLPASIQITPDYSRAVEEVYQAAVLSLIAWSKSLEPLIYAGNHQRPLLPSWAYDFSERCVQSIEYGCFRAGAEVLPMRAENVGRGRLLVHGKILDTVRLVGPRATGVAQWETEDEDILRNVRGFLQAWRPLVRSDDDVAWEEETSDRFWRTVAMDMVFLKGPTRWQRYTAKAFDKRETELWLEDTDAGSATLSEGTRQNLLWIAQCSVHEHVFFITERGSYGMISRDLEEGEVIAFLAGASLPFVLRRVGGGDERAYKVIGPCYLDGIMHGEAAPVEDDDDDDSPMSALDVGFEEMVLI